MTWQKLLYNFDYFLLFVKSIVDDSSFKKQNKNILKLNFLLEGKI